LNHPPNQTIHQSATFALDLARQPEGYLCAWSEVIEELRDQGLVTVHEVGDGFVIIRTVPPPKPPESDRVGRWFRRVPDEMVGVSA
jgi:hypothetical protein